MTAAAETSNAPLPMWTRQVRQVDAVVVGLTVVMALLTLWVASDPVGDFIAFVLLGALWLPIGAIWALSIAMVAKPSRTIVVIVLLGLGAFSVVFGLPPFAGFLFVAVIGIGGLVLAASVALGRPILLQPPLRLAWLVAPIVVVATLGIVISGIPRVIRFAVAESALTAYASDLLRQPPVGPPEEMPSRSVGGLAVEWSAVDGGCAHLVTGYVGILDEDPAGLAYCPSGLPTADDQVGSYEPVRGAWYVWFARSEFPFD